ncbi:Hypothetical protein, putative [Bodo saltans]|uniref:Uncharacterized protein n=1 Tax=Bodo saltans TaxID=75058 RepID=A0A0S4JDG3_BODSA|nr:Hypothetical protein, putative [Bodo saltans]|eukprot:CUG88088.1 Hypothetical protein, putative [Bodo saltans]
MAFLFDLKVKALAQPLGTENAWNELGDGRVSFVGYTIRVVAPMSAFEPNEEGAEAEQNEPSSPSQEAEANSNAAAESETKDESSTGNDAPSSPKSNASLATAAVNANTNENALAVSEVPAKVEDDDNDTASPHGSTVKVSTASLTQQMMIVLEDNITDETPFVGENCCIVWNSIEQELSLCMMFSTEFEYQAAWSALAAVQHKPYPPLGRDVFVVHNNDDASPKRSETSVAVADEVVDEVTEEKQAIPYSDLISSSTVTQYSFIERHAIALSLIEFGHLHRPELYADNDVCVALLKLGHADLLEHLVSPSVYFQFVAGLDPTSPAPNLWNVPHSLKETLTVTAELEVCLRTALCLHHLKHEVLPLGIDEDVLAIIDGVNHRLQNEAACSLLADDNLIRAAVHELSVVPIDDAPPRMSRSTTPTEAIPAVPLTPMDAPKAKEMPPHIAEEHVADHLRFFSSLISLSITAFSKELVAPVMGKIFSYGLLETLSSVADRYTVTSMMPASHSSGSFSRQASPENLANTSRPPSSGSSSINRPAPPSKEAGASSRPGRPPRHLGAKFPGRVYSARVEAELCRLLDATMVRLNEKQEEVAVNDFFRVPILENPENFSGLVSFLLRQMLAAPSDAEIGRSMSSERGVCNNALLLFHLVGMHDDEGSSSSDRMLDPENDVRRNEFHAYVIKNLIGPSCKGLDVANISTPSTPQVNHGEVLMSSAGKPATLAAPLIRLIEYLLKLVSFENRELLLLRIFDPASLVLGYIEQSFQNAMSNNRAASPAPDVLCGHIRFIKAILTCVCGPVAVDALSAPPQINLNIAVADIKDEASHLLIPPCVHRGMDQKILALAAKVLSIDRQTFSIILELYAKTGGTRKQGLMHCTIRSMLLMIATAEGTNAENLSTFLMIKYRKQLPTLFIDAAEKRLLESVTAKLDVLGVVKPSGRNSASPVLVHGVSNLDISAASSSPQQSPLGRYLVDELASPPDAKQMEDVAAFPKRLRQAIGRLSPTPRGSSHADDMSSGSGGGDGSPSTKSELYLMPIPRGSSPMPSGLTSTSPLPSASKLELEKPLLVAETQQGTTETENVTAKPTAPKQAKTAGGRGSTNGRHLSDGKPIMRSK